MSRPKSKSPPVLPREVTRRPSSAIQIDQLDGPIFIYLKNIGPYLPRKERHE